MATLGLGRAGSYRLRKVQTSESMQYRGTHCCYFQALLSRRGQGMDLKRTANVKQVLRSALFQRQSYAGKGRWRRRKSNRGSGAAFLHVLKGNHCISPCTEALLQKWVVYESSSLQTSTMLWRGPRGDSPVLWSPGHCSHCPHHSRHSRQEKARKQQRDIHCNCKCWRR